MTNGALILRVAGVVVWISLGLLPFKSLFFGHARVGPNAIVWGCAFVLFGILYWRASKAMVGARILPSTVPLIVLQSLLALLMFDLVCSSFNAALSVIVAAEVGFTVLLRFGVLWMLAQSGLTFLLALSHDWELVDALRWTASVLGAQLFALLVCYLGASESRAKMDLVRTNAELRATRDLLESSIRFAERVRISREIHDLLGHHLTALSLNLEVASHLAASDAKEPLEKAKAVTKILLSDVREAVSSLRAEDAVDLSHAMGSLIEGVSTPEIHLDIPAKLDIADAERAHTLLRCTQEIITNTIRHADASNLWIALTRSDGRIALSAHDDGRGVRSLCPGNGINGMRERLAILGGTLHIGSSDRGGLSILLELPAQESAG